MHTIKSLGNPLLQSSEPWTIFTADAGVGASEPLTYTVATYGPGGRGILDRKTTHDREEAERIWLRHLMVYH